MVGNEGIFSFELDIWLGFFKLFLLDVLLVCDFKEEFIIFMIVGVWGWLLDILRGGEVIVFVKKVLFLFLMNK